jgi:glycosyl-4,4'-diaponeurosporenoate acyltransferase
VGDAVLNVLWWAVVHAGTGYGVHRLPVAALGRDTRWSRPRPWERRAYERIGVRRWKDRLPEAGALFPGGVSKRDLRAGVARFVVETRRAELGHWLAMLGGPVSALWNPALGAVLMVTYGVAVNAPFVVVQRYNRARALPLLTRSRTRGSSIP